MMIYEILLNDTKYLVEVDETEARLKKEQRREEEEEFSLDIPDIMPYDESVGGEDIRTTMPGQVISVNVREGDHVQAGESIALLQETTLQFELWQNGNPINPEEVIPF